MKYPLTRFSFPRTFLARVLILLLAPCVLRAQASAPAPSQGSASPQSDTGEAQVVIPGPLRSFLRMAGISQQVSPQEVLPLLSRNVVLQGYRGNRQTEFLILLIRYVHQARELAALAGPDNTIRVANCAEAKALLHVIGYRARPDCGQADTHLVTSDAERAFVTIDSGFPILTLEEALQGKEPFIYPFPGSTVPILLTEKDWLSAANGGERPGLLDALLSQRDLSQLYWALYRNDAETRSALAKDIGLKNLLPFAATLDLYGSQLSIQAGHVIVPGGIRAEASWNDLVGANPRLPKEFVLHLLDKDKGWTAAYYDALSRTSRVEQEHFTEKQRIKRCYEAFREAGVSPDVATRLAFRPAPSLLLLVNQLQWEANGEPHVPGNLSVWKDIVGNANDFKVSRRWRKRSSEWKDPEHLLEALFAFSRVETETGPLQAFLFMNELDARRPAGKALSPETVKLLADNFADFSNQYLIFSEFPQLDDVSISRFIGTAQSVGKISNHTLRGNAMGTFQANVGLWQILARQGEIPDAQLNDSWQKVLEPFAKISSPSQLVDAGRASLQAVMLAASGNSNISQDAIIELLAGPRQEDAQSQRVHQEVANKIRAVMDGQRLVSLDTLLALGEGLTEMAKGEKPDTRERLVALSGELREFEMPQPIFSSGERTEWAEGTYNNRHTELQMRTDLARVLKSPKSVAQLEDARGELAPFLRDTLVGLNYAYYEPPGAQMLLHNPLFVRSHDFSGDTVIGVEHVWQAPHLIGEGTPAGGGAHLIGSLADLPYVLSEVEEDFIAPDHVQALIWRQLVPSLLTDATVPRWWNVSKDELHAVTLYQRTGEELLTKSAMDSALRDKVMAILSDRMTMKSAVSLADALREKRAPEALLHLNPADSSYLAAEFLRQHPDEGASVGPAAQELQSLVQAHPAELSWERIARDFGAPHPVMMQSYGRNLLNVKPFPALTGYCSRLMAESWDSNNLYWARLADEMGYSPPDLNQLVPQLTRRMIENIFATEPEDWTAILRAMRETGDEFRQGKTAWLWGTDDANSSR